MIVKAIIVVLSTIPILGWHGVSQDKFEEVFPLMKEAGFDGYLQRVTDVDRAIRMLDAAQSCGLMVIPGFSDLYSDPETFVPKIMNHPALMAYYLKDEPETWDLEELGKLVRRIQSIDTSIPCYINLYPNWAWQEEKYVENINMFMDNCPVPFVSFDQYPVTEVDGMIVIRDTWYRNLEEIHKLCRDRGVPMWAFSLLYSHHLGAPSPEAFYPVPTIGQLRLQVFSDLAYGAQAIQYYTVRGAIDVNGEKTPVYEIVKQVNSEIKGLSPVFLGCTVEDVWHIGEQPRGTKALKSMPHRRVKRLEVSGKGAVVSLITNGAHKYLAVVNKDCVNPAHMEIKLSRRVRIVSKDFKMARFRGTAIDIDPGDMVLFCIE